MGEIITSKVMPDRKVVCKIILDKKELLGLKGHLKNIQIFSSEMCTNESCVNQRGNNGVTKYFRIPLSIRSRKKHSGQLLYQKLDLDSKTFYLYVLKKN